MVKEIYVKTVLNKHKKRDKWFLDDYSLNPYKNCEFNCHYCYIHASNYGRNVGEVLAVKINAPTVLAKQLSRRARKGEYGYIALSSATEPWMYIEEKYKVTRKCLEVIAHYKFPVHCLTKSTLILRDLDLLTVIDREAKLPPDLQKEPGRGILITYSFSTLDEENARTFEPNAPAPRERLNTIQKLREEGFLVGIAYMPILPYITDTLEELEEMVKTAKEVDAQYLFFSPLTYPGKRLLTILQKHYPQLVNKYKLLYKGKWLPNKQYNNQFYKKVTQLCKKHKIKIGIKPIKL